MVDEFKEYDEYEDPPEISFYDKDGVEWSKNPGYTSNVLEGEVGYNQNEKQDSSVWSSKAAFWISVASGTGSSETFLYFPSTCSVPRESMTFLVYVNISENCTNPLKDTASSITPSVEEEYMSMD